jgi:hypothetical protein
VRSREPDSAGWERKMPESAIDKPFQFGLVSLFVATSAVAVAISVLKQLGLGTFIGFLIVVSITVLVTEGVVCVGGETRWSSRILRWAGLIAFVWWLALLADGIIHLVRAD